MYGDSDAVFKICTGQLIHAALELVYDTLIDYTSYHLWSSFVVDVEVPPNVKTPEGVYVDMLMTLITSGVTPLINTTSAEVVTGLEKSMPTWRSNNTMLGVLIVAEHPNILVDQGNGFTRYVSYETYYQEPLILSLLTIKPTLQKLFEQHGMPILRLWLRRLSSTLRRIWDNWIDTTQDKITRVDSKTFNFGSSGFLLDL